jgi:hypothetical protein
MNIIDFIKRILHIGGPQIDLVTRDTQYYPSDLIRGDLAITAPDYRQNIQSITVNLKEFWVEYLTRGGSALRGGTSMYHQHDSTTIANGFVFEPRMQYRFPFEVQLPRNCRVSSKESGWRLGVVITAFGSHVSRADFDINVQLSKVLQTIIEAIEKSTKFTEVPRGRKFIPNTFSTRLIFRPPEHLQSDLQYFKLDVSFTDEGGIEGNMLFNMTESMITGGKHSHEFQIKPTHLFHPDGKVDTSTITNIISAKSFEAIASRKNH